MAEDREVKQRISTGDFDLDIQIRISAVQVDQFEDGETETCSTCGSCTSECDGGETLGGCEVVLFEDRLELVVTRVSADGSSQKVEKSDVLRRIERADGR